MPRFGIETLTLFLAVSIKISQAVQIAPSNQRLVVPASTSLLDPSEQNFGNFYFQLPNQQQQQQYHQVPVVPYQQYPFQQQQHQYFQQPYFYNGAIFNALAHGQPQEQQQGQQPLQEPEPDFIEPIPEARGFPVELHENQDSGFFVPPQFKIYEAVPLE